MYHHTTDEEKDKNIFTEQSEDQKSTFPVDLSNWIALFKLQLLQ